MPYNFLNLNLLCLFGLVFLVACNSEDNSNSDQKGLLKSWGQTVDKLSKKLDTSPFEDMANEEVEKLFTFEYLVKDIPSNKSPEEANQELSKLGNERWDCFHVEKNNWSTRLYCKRRPKTYLRLIPRVF